MWEKEDEDFLLRQIHQKVQLRGRYIAHIPIELGLENGLNHQLLKFIGERFILAQIIWAM